MSDSMVKFDYTPSDLLSALEKCGVKEGSNVFCHSNIGFFGRLSGGETASAACGLILSAFMDLIGESGTLVVPTFSYSFGSDKKERIFDPAVTPSACGMFSEYVRLSACAERSCDPMFSVAAVGALAAQFTDGSCRECFGEDSFWSRFLQAEGMIVNLNCDAGSTFIHFVERRLAVPYRQNRPMKGYLVENGVKTSHEVDYFARRLDDYDATPSFIKFDKIARERGVVKTCRVGRGAVVAISAADTLALIEGSLPCEPFLLTILGND